MQKVSGGFCTGVVPCTGTVVQVRNTKRSRQLDGVSHDLEGTSHILCTKYHSTVLCPPKHKCQDPRLVTLQPCGPVAECQVKTAPAPASSTLGRQATDDRRQATGDRRQAKESRGDWPGRLHISELDVE